MHILKKIITFLLVFALIFSFISCGPKAPVTPTHTEDTVDKNGSADFITAPTPTPPAILDIANDPPLKGTQISGIIPEEISTLTGLTSLKDLGWSIQSGGKVSLSETGGNDGACVYFECGADAWHSWTFNLYNYIKEAGEYTVTFDLLLEGEKLSEIEGDAFIPFIRGNASDVNSFIQKDPKSGNCTYTPEASVDGLPGEWSEVSVILPVSESDIEEGIPHRWDLCFNGINSAIKGMYIDNIEISGIVYDKPSQVLVTEAETWVKEEMTFLATTKIVDPLSATFDVIFKKDRSEIKVPGFWDGDNVWKIRFALPAQGYWSFTTVFSDTSDTGLHGVSGSINVTKYSGELDIYKHGFITADPNKKYFVYDDGTPFFYLGDTHWNFMKEEYDSAGEFSGNIVTDSHFKYIVNKRVSQGYTVYQSQPNSAPFNLADGILSPGDVQGFKQMDKYFEYIASQGLVHANSQFFFSKEMISHIMTMDNYESYLDKISRYWVARYSAYPVIWTLAQEVDNDYFFMDKTNTFNTVMTAENNPWKMVCESIYKYDPHKNPISAHQESCSKIMDQTSASNSAFRDTKGHSWWAAQWKPKLNQKLDFSAARDFWENGQNKPAIVYEARYDHLWTNEYGCRIQGWLAFLNGFCGHGYGAVDIWLYDENYDQEQDTVRDGITITVQDKKIRWAEAVNFNAGYQMSYMKAFLEEYEWWKLTPLFESSKFISETGTYSAATIEDNIYILYFYDAINGEGTALTGTLKGLDKNAQYTYKWFNPRNAQSSEEMNVALTDEGDFTIGARPSSEDWVLVVNKK